MHGTKHKSNSSAGYDARKSGQEERGYNQVVPPGHKDVRGSLGKHAVPGGSKDAD